MGDFDLATELLKHARYEFVDGKSADWLETAAHQIAALEAENARLKAIVERLPKNADGDPVCIGMNQYAAGVDPCDPDSSVAAFGFISLHEPEEDGEWWGDVRGKGGDEWRTSVCRCYSTREAAEEAGQ